MDFIDDKYINLLSPRLQKFKRVKSGLYNFRCPICGDSQKNKSKARGYFYQVKSNTNFKCHNCGLNISLNNFIKKIDINLYKQYTLEKFKEGHTGKNFVVEEPKFVFEKPLFQTKIVLPLCSEVERGKSYLESRKIDPRKFYFAERFKEFVNSLKPTFAETNNDESRIIIPLFYKKNLVGLQGRSLNSSPNKYITVMFSDDSPKIYGLDEIDKTNPVYVAEGPFDSTFLRNCIALCGADGDLSNWDIHNVVWVYDNEPRNREIHSRMVKVIERNEKIVIWPSNISQKDINDMVLSGLNVQSIVESNTYSGLEAKLKFTTWKKI
jgi:transcription elongation factor Elf1